MLHCRMACVLVGMAWAGSRALAVVATVQVEAIKQGVGVINELEPGQTATILVTVTWDDPMAQFAGLRGDTIVGGALGEITNVDSALREPGSTQPFIRLGHIWAGSLIDTDIAIIPIWFTGSIWPWTLSYDGMPFVHFEWTAPAVSVPTEVHFDFSTYAIAPNARFYPNLSNQLQPVEAETTFIGTTITVLPAPSGAAAVLAWGVVWSARRRRLAPMGAFR